MAEWEKYTGSDEQIAAIWNHYNGFLLNTTDKILTKDNFTDSVSFEEYLKHGVTSYWLIPADPLRGMKIHQAKTGQPVWWRSIDGGGTGLCHEHFPPFAHPDKFEYRFTPFEDEL